MDTIKIRVFQVADRVGIFIKRNEEPEIEMFTDRCDIKLDSEVADPFNLTNRVTLRQDAK